MKYLVIGTGGTGGSIGSLLEKAGRDVTVIARGGHLEMIKSKGLVVENSNTGARFTVHPRAYDMESYGERPDVIFVCVKGYSLDGTIPFIKKISKESTVVIPILNIYGTGGEMQKKLPGILVTDACIYVSATIKEPGVIEMYNDSVKIYFGARTREEYRPVLGDIEDDLKACGINAVNSDNIQRDTMIKYSFISPVGATAIYYGCPIGEIQKPGEIRDCYVSLIRELTAVSAALGIKFENDLVEANLRMVDNMAPTSTVSLLRDVQSGHQAEIDGQIFHVVRMARELKVPVPAYEKIAAKFGFN